MMTICKWSAVSVAAAALLVYAGCSKSSAPTANTAPAAASNPAPPGPVTAKTAFWLMYKSARDWAPDVEVLRLDAKEVPGFKNEAGKAAMWEATFASPGKRESRAYSYAIADALPDVHKGVAAALEAPWGGETRDVMPVDLALFNVDSDAAYAAASAAATDWLKKNPDKPLAVMELGDTYKFQAPVWYLMWGNKKSGYVGLVDAASGKVLQKKK